MIINISVMSSIITTINIYVISIKKKEQHAEIYFCPHWFSNLLNLLGFFFPHNYKKLTCAFLLLRTIRILILE